MKSGYDQFFVKAKKNAVHEPVNFRQSKKKKKLPFFPFVSFGACLIMAFLLIEKFDSIEDYLSKIEIGLGTAQAEVTAPLENKAGDAKSEVKSEGKAEVSKSDEDSTDYLFKLAERKKELDAREEELNKREAEVVLQKTEVETKLKQLDESREKISTMLKERIASDGKKVDNLVQVYSNMKPSQAAKVFETMDEDLVIEILSKMKKKNAADILNLVKTEKAQKFSESYAGYRKPAAVPETSEPSKEIKGTEETTKP